MARANKPWFRESKRTWYVKVEGKQTSLGVKGLDKEAEAVKAWYKVMAGVTEKAKPKPKPEPTVSEVLTAFLADAEARVKPTTLENYRYFLLPFSAKHGKLKADALTPTLAEAYSRKPTWSADTRADFLGALRTAFRWAERGRIIDKTPLVGLKLPPRRPEGRKR